MQTRKFSALTALIPLIFMVLSPATDSAAAFSGISVRDLHLPPSVPLKSENYTLDPVVQPAAEEGFLKFHVQSSHGAYEVEGILPLKKLLHEIDVIEEIEKKETGNNFLGGVTDSLSATGSGFVQLVGHPVESVKGIGKAAGKLGRSIGGIFRSQEEGEKTSFDDKIMGASEREVAKKLDVDVYTDNPYLKPLLREMAKARMGGKGAVFVVQLLIPVALIVSVTVTASNLNSAADRLVNDKDRTELYRLNREALLGLGFELRDVADFLNNPHYSPREATYLRFYLEKLQKVRGGREIMKTALRADSVWKARKILYAAQIAADQMKEPGYAQMRVYPEGIAAEETKGIIFVTPYDYLGRSSLGDRVLKRVSEVKRLWGDKPVEIRNGGKVTSDFMAAAFLQGAKTRGWFLLEPSPSYE